MTAWLYLHDPVDLEQPLACTWWRLPEAVSQGSLADAAADLCQGSLVLLLPSEIASHHQVEVPARSGRWRLQAVHSALEETLLDDPDSLHLAFGPWQGKRSCRLFALPAQWLEQCLAQLANHGLQPLRIHVDSDCLGERQPTALHCAGRWLIGGSSPLRLSLAPQDIAELAPTLPADFHWHGVDDSPWQCLTEGSTQAIDLRQGSFSLRKPVRAPWRLLAGVMVLAAVALLLHNTGQRLLLEHYSERLAAENQAAFIQRFPDETRIVDLRRQLQSRLAQSQPPQASLARRLEQLAEHWSRDGGNLVVIKQLDYQANSGWTFAVQAPAFADIERLRQRLEAQGIKVQTEEAVRLAEGVSARVRIRE